MTDRIAELEQQLAQARDHVAELEAYALGCDAEGCTTPHSSWCERAKKAAAANDGCTCPQPWKDSPQPHAGYCWLVSPPRDEIELARKRIAELCRDLAHSESIRANADFHLGQEMARRQLAEKETARLADELAHATRPSYSNRHIWTVWREDQPAHAHYATLDDARQGSIDCWEEDEPACPDYSWKSDGPRLELLVGGEAGEVYISRSDVFGKQDGPALPWAHVMDDHDLGMFLDDLVSAALGRWRSEPDTPVRQVLADIEKACTDWRTPGHGYRSEQPAGGEQHA